MRILIFISSLFISSFALSADYYWSIGGPDQTRYSSPSAACDARPRATNPNGDYYQPAGALYVGSDFYRCLEVSHQVSTGNVSSPDVYLGQATNRWGNSCPEGSTYIPATGLCDTPEKDKCQAAFEAGASGPYTVKTQLNGDPPSTVDIAGCEATFGGVILCRNKTDGTAQCTGTARITGKKTEAATAPVAGEGKECSGDDCLKDAPQYEEDKLACNYTVDPNTGAKTCTSKETTSKPGTTKCTQSGSSWTCTETPKSVSTDKTTNTTVTDKSNIDGSTETKQTDNTTVKNCTGINSCSTSTSTTITTGGTTSGGTPTNPNSSCTGAACNGSSGGSNDGSGDEQGSEDGENIYPTVTALSKPTNPGNLDSANTEWDQKIEESKQQLKQKMEQVSDLFQPLEQMNLVSGDAELPCGETFEIPGGNRTFSTSICFGNYESQLSIIAAAVLFICALIALFIIFKPEN